MHDDQLLRYSRHILLDELGIEGQARLLAGHALVVGAGGLGSAALLYLASAGVGRLTVVDPDRVELSNLQRQVVHATASLGQAKAESAAARLAALNPEVRVRALVERAEGERLAALVAEADVVLDCSDNFPTRQALNRACVQAGKPLVSGAAVRFDGQLAVFDTRPGPGGPGPCYACVFPPGEVPEAVPCATLGVFAPLVGVIGALQAGEALQLLAGTRRPAQLLLHDARRGEWTPIRLSPRADCPVCAPSSPRPESEPT